MGSDCMTSQVVGFREMDQPPGRRKRHSFGNDRLRLVVLFCLLLEVVWIMPSTVYANAFRINDQSASATAQNGAFSAQADDPSALYYNPAGMTQLRGVQLSVGTLLVGGRTEFTSPAGATARGDFGTSIGLPPPSQLYVTANLKDLGFHALGDLTVGVGALLPFGVLYQYPNNGPFSTAVTSQTLPLVDIKPTVAYRVTDNLSLGVGADIYTFASFLGTGRAVTKFNNAGLPGVPVGAPVEVNGKDTAAGFNLSLLYTALRNSAGKPIANIGLVYRSQATLLLDGDFLVNGARAAGASTTLVLPQVLTGAVALWPVRDDNYEWKLELDVDYTGWKSIRNLDVHLMPGGTVPFPQNWRSGFTVIVGTEYKWLRPGILPAWEIALRGGYYFGQTPIPDSSFLPTVPDADQHGISAGIGFLCKDTGHFLGFIPCESSGSAFYPKAIGLDLAYQAIFYETRTVTGSANPVAIPGVLNGTYDTTLHVGAITARVMF